MKEAESGVGAINGEKQVSSGEKQATSGEYQVILYFIFWFVNIFRTHRSWINNDKPLPQSCIYSICWSLGQVFPIHIFMYFGVKAATRAVV